MKEWEKKQSEMNVIKAAIQEDQARKLAQHEAIRLEEEMKRVEQEELLAIKNAIAEELKKQYLAIIQDEN